MQAFPHRYTVEASGSETGDVELNADGVPPVRSASPIPFDGPGDRWSPETLLVAAVGDCLILTFRAVARASGFAWTSLECDVTGTLDRIERTTRFVAFEIRARLRVPPGTDPDRARQVLEKAERSCLISNSLSGATRLVPTIDVAAQPVRELTAVEGGRRLSWGFRTSVRPAAVRPATPNLITSDRPDQTSYNGSVSSGDIKAEYAALVKAAATGDRGAMEALLVRAQEVAYRFSLLVCGHPEDAEDVMQDALLKTYQHVATISEPEAFRTWLYSTVRNACLMKRRRRVGEPSNFVSVERGIETSDGTVPVDVADPSRSIDQRLIDGWVDDRLREALKRLPSSYRLIVVMREIEGLSTKEVAAIAGVSEANVKTRLHRARLMLRKKLEHV